MSSNRIKQQLKYAAGYAAIPAAAAFAFGIAYLVEMAKGDENNTLLGLDIAAFALTGIGATWGWMTGGQKADLENMKKMKQILDATDSFTIGDVHDIDAVTDPMDAAEKGELHLDLNLEVDKPTPLPVIPETAKPQSSSALTFVSSWVNKMRGKHCYETLNAENQEVIASHNLR